MNVVGPIATGIGVVFVAWMLKRSFQGFIDDRIGAVERSVGKPNGNGNLTEMTEKLLAWQAEQLRWQDQHDNKDETQFGKVFDRQDKQARQLDRLAKRLDSIEKPEGK